MKNSDAFHLLTSIQEQFKLSNKQIEALKHAQHLLESEDLLSEKLKSGESILTHQLANVRMDEDIANLGFTCNGKLCEKEGYEIFYERFWEWENPIAGLSVITFDEGNTHCGVVAIKPLCEEWPKPCYIDCRSWCTILTGTNSYA